ncbi:MAG: hypothetical protein ACK583_02780 [Cyanobacteriota bacterium]
MAAPLRLRRWPDRVALAPMRPHHGPGRWPWRTASPAPHTFAPSFATAAFSIVPPNHAS